MHVKLLFLAGRSLKPPRAAGKERNAMNFRSGDDLSEQQVGAWPNQAKEIPGWMLKNFPG